jgi:hypothetical protein
VFIASVITINPLTIRLYVAESGISLTCMKNLGVAELSIPNV